MPLWIARLLHVLVFVYWLGGDIGAFYAARLVVDPGLPRPARLAAWRVLAAVDILPGVCLILALPTGLILASSAGWLALPGFVLVAAGAIGAGWAAAFWAAQLRHGGGPAFKRADLAARYLLASGLLACVGLGLAGRLAIPGFILAKLSILAATVVLGLIIRRLLLGPFSTALVALMAGRETPHDNAIIASAMARARIAVLMLWALLLAAACLGLRAQA
jgi:hypothetical protein